MRWQPGRAQAVVAAVGVLAVAAGVAAVRARVTAEQGSAVTGAEGHRFADAIPASERALEPNGSFMEGLTASRGGVERWLSCEDWNHDNRLNGADDASFTGVDFPLTRHVPCDGPRRVEFYAGPPDGAVPFDCSGRPRPTVFVAVPGGGTDLMDRNSGTSVGLVDTLNELQAAARAAAMGSESWVTTPAIAAADMPQLRMEQWLEGELTRELTRTPCLRAVIIGHSHGAVTVTALLSALEGRFAGRLFGVPMDRTLMWYDHEATELPNTSPVLNVYQTAEGWHGGPTAAPNIENYDATGAAGPSDGIGPPVPVTHLTLDDAPEVRRVIVERVMRWLALDAHDEGVIAPGGSAR